MRNFTRKVHLLLALLCCVFSTSVWAQEEENPTIQVGENTIEIVSTFEPQVQLEAGTAYSGNTIGFDAKEVARVLGIENIKDAAQYIVNADGTCVENTTDGWRDKDGNAADWGTGEGMVCVKINDPASGIVDYIGAIDETHVKGDTYVARWAFVANNVAVLVNVNIAFVQTHPEFILVGEAQVPVVTIQDVPVEVFEKTAYTGDTGTFDAAALAEALGVEALSKAKAYVVNPTTGEAVVQTDEDGWRNGYGDITHWGTAPSSVCVKINEPDAGLIDYIGAIDETHVKGEVPYVAMWAFVANDKAVLVNTVITFVVDPASLVEVPEPETDVTKVTVVKTLEVSSDRYATGGYETSPVELDADDLAEAFGIEKEDLTKVFSQLVYVIGEDEIGCKSNTLQHISITDGWFAQAIENIEGMAGDPLDEVIAEGYGGNCKFFIHDMAYDAETNQVSFVVGQYPGNLSTGESWPASLYIMWGDKAYVIRYTMNIVEPPFIGFDGMEQVGETIELSYEQKPTSDFSAVSVLLDTAAAAEALGCDEASISLKALISEDGFSTTTTANNGGWWFDRGGFVTNYGNNSAFYVEPAESGNYAALNMGQMPGVLQDGESVSVNLFLVADNKYIQYRVTLNVVQKEIEGDWQDWESVATRSLTIQQEGNDGYSWSEKVGVITNEELISLIGTTAPTLYGLLDPATVADGQCPYTDDYTMGEKPGFWLSPEGYRADWNNNAPWGITSQAGTTGITNGWGFKCMQMPGQGVVGNSFSGTFYLVNEENGKMITVNVTNTIVNEIIESDVVGTMDVSVPVSTNDYEAEFDLEPIAQAIGYENYDAMASEYVMYGIKANGQHSELQEPSTWLYLDIEGNVVTEEEGQIFIYFENGNINVSCNDFDPAEDWERQIEVFFQHPTTGKCYIIRITLMSEKGFTAIRNINDHANSKAIYDLSGRQTSKMGKGLYIINNKVVVK